MDSARETKALSKSDIDKLFAEWWKAYPRHTGGHIVARARYEQAIRQRKVDPADLLAAAVRYRDDPNREDAYTAHASTWLNAGRWADDPLPARGEPIAAALISTPKRPQW